MKNQKKEKCGENEKQIIWKNERHITAKSEVVKEYIRDEKYIMENAKMKTSVKSKSVEVLTKRVKKVIEFFFEKFKKQNYLKNK